MKTKYTFVLLMVFFTLFAVNKAKSQFVTGTQTIGSGSNQLDISISVDSSFNILKFVVTGPSTKWFGFSYNTTSMSPGSYTILCNVNGGNPGEYIMVEHAAPNLQSTQNLQSITSSTNSGRKTFTFYRNLTTSDANDYVFSYYANNISIAWAHGSGLPLAQHEDRGSSSIIFINPCTTIIPTMLSSISICHGDSTMIFGSYKKVAGTYSKTIKRQLACDSIVKQTLIVLNPTTTTLTPKSICNGDSIIIFNKFRKIAGNYYDTLQSIHSCDSILLQALNVIMIDTMVINVADSLKAVQGADSYQWYDCTTNQAINNATNYYYKATVSGNYRVKINKNNCVSYSSCHHITITGINNISNTDTRFQLHPNPATDKITVNFDRFDGSAHFEIFDITGKSIVNQVLLNNTKSETIDVSMLKTGIYFVKFTNNEQSISKKLIIN
ncbi:MAG: T9SS type A sorting domain-containing protein [Bacteroidales bacterium]